jgi:hypothetical protein
MISRRQILTVAAAAAVATSRDEGLPSSRRRPSRRRWSISPSRQARAIATPTCSGIRDEFPLRRVEPTHPNQRPSLKLRALHQALHMDRVVIVQPSVYGTDNACTLDAIKLLGSRARGGSGGRRCNAGLGPGRHAPGRRARHSASTSPLPPDGSGGSRRSLQGRRRARRAPQVAISR